MDITDLEGWNVKDLVIIGAGGVGRETAMVVEQINQAGAEWNLLGFIDDDVRLHGALVNRYKVLGGMDRIDSFKEAYVVCAIANCAVRKSIICAVRQKVKGFANIIHPSVYLSPDNSIGEGNIIYPGVVLSTNVTIGNHVIISPKCGIGHDAVIRDYCSLLWNVNVSGHVDIGEGVTMGSGSTVIQNRIIGEGTIVGAGATVIHDLPPYCTAVGVPARVIKNNIKPA